MGRDASKASENICFLCRKEAAKYNDRLSSREGAAEMLGVSVSCLADYELGITKVIPVDKIVLMAELYNSPEMKLWYCSSECPIGRTCKALPSDKVSTVERTTLALLQELEEEKVEKVMNTLIKIASDGLISDDEKIDLAEILNYVDALIKAAGGLKLMGEKVMNGER